MLVSGTVEKRISPQRAQKAQTLRWRRFHWRCKDKVGCHGPSAPWPTFAKRERKKKSGHSGRDDREEREAGVAKRWSPWDTTDDAEADQGCGEQRDQNGPGVEGETGSGSGSGFRGFVGHCVFPFPRRLILSPKLILRVVIPPLRDPAR